MSITWWPQPPVASTTLKRVNIKKGSKNNIMTDSNKNPDLKGDNNPNGNENTVILSKEEYNKLVLQQANLSQDKANLVSEITELRKKNQLTEQEKIDLANKVKQSESLGKDGTIQPTEVRAVAEKVVQEVFEKQKTVARKTAREQAEQKFLNEHPEFKPENDIGGLKKAALDKKLANFNLDKFNSEEEFLTVYVDANNLLGNVSNPNVVTPKVIPSMPSHNGADQSPKKDVQLTPQEQKIVTQFLGGDVEKFIKQKEKRPDYIASLLQYVK